MAEVGCIVCSHAKTRPCRSHVTIFFFYLSWLQSLLPSQNRERNEQRLKKSSSSQHYPITPRQSTSERGALSSGFDEQISFLALSFLFFLSSSRRILLTPCVASRIANLSTPKNGSSACAFRSTIRGNRKPEIFSFVFYH